MSSLKDENEMVQTTIRKGGCKITTGGGWESSDHGKKPGRKKGCSTVGEPGSYLIRVKKKIRKSLKAQRKTITGRGQGVTVRKRIKNEALNWR